MSLKYRIAVVIFLLEAVMMTLVLSTTVNRSQHINKAQFEMSENVILELLADLSRVALFSSEYEELQPYIENISADPRVTRILIIDRENRITASSDVNDVGSELTPLADTPSTYWRQVTISNASGVLGRIAMNFSNDALITARKEILFAGLKVALIGMTFIAVVGLFTGYLLTRRLDILSSAAKEIESGNLDVRTSLPGRDEIGHLGQVFDNMAASFKMTIKNLHAHELELKKAQDELEIRVEERTYELEQLNEELEHLATHDPLTSLPNRSVLMVRLNQAISHADKEHTSFATIIMDLDKFKQINDSLGHAIGDELLIQASGRISTQLRKTDTVARVGGDEFAIILSDLTVEQAMTVCEKISASLAEAFTLKEHIVHIGSSIGIAMYPEHSTDSNILLKYADAAMYAAKNSHKDFSVYDQGDKQFNTSISSMDSSLRNALKNDEYVLHFQPKWDYQSHNLVGAEALVRWQHSERLILPCEFIPYAESTGLIVPLTIWVLNAAMKQHAQWLQSGIDMTMSVNLSARNLRDPSLLEQLSVSLERWQVDPGKLIVEITETSILADTNQSVAVLRQLKDMGIRISIDDFGTGYSSLIYLKQMPVDEIKIDRSFIVDVDSNEHSLLIVRSIVDLAHKLGICVTTEGVETANVWKLLASLECDTSQGYYLGHPVTAEEFYNTYIARLNSANHVAR